MADHFHHCEAVKNLPPQKNKTLFVFLQIRQIDIRTGPKVAKIANREFESHSHFGGHQNNQNVPSQETHYEEHGSSSLNTS